MTVLETAVGNGQVHLQDLSPTGSEVGSEFNTFYNFFSTDPGTPNVSFLGDSEDNARDVHNSKVYVRLGSTGDRIDLNEITDNGFSSSNTSRAVSNPFIVEQNGQTVDVSLIQSLSDIEAGGVRIGGQLRQAYTFSNTGDDEVLLEFFKYADIDLTGSSDYEDDGGGRKVIDGVDWVFQTDRPVAGDVQTELIAIRIEGGEDLSGAYGLDQYNPALDDNPLLEQIRTGGSLPNTVLGDGVDADELVDAGNGLDLAVARGKFLRIPPGKSASISVYTVYGQLSFDQLTELTVSGPILELSPTGFLVVENSQLESQVQFSLESNSVDRSVEIVAVVTDDENGTIDGITVGEEGYAEAERDRSKFIFSAAQNNKFKDLEIENVIDVPSGQFINFKAVQAGSFFDLGSPVSVLAEAANSSEADSTGVQYTLLEDGRYQLTFRVPQTDGSLGDIKLTAATGTFEKSLGSGLQGTTAESEVIDLRNIADATVQAKFDVYREADLVGIVGFYSIDHEDGRIFSETDGLLYPGDEGYVQAALSNRIDVELTTENAKHSTYSAEIETGQLLASFFVSDRSLDRILDEQKFNDPSIFFTHVGANSDGVDHVQLLGANTFGFEDTSGGGDMDFNDLVVKTTIS